MCSQLVQLATREFKTKSATKVYFKEMLTKYSPGNRIRDDNEKDLGALLKRHPAWAKKVGAGIDHFEVAFDTEFATKCFCAVRTDGTKENISIHTCLSALSG